jgi:pyridoxal phosphate enzyme (YggS family)
MIHSVDSLRLIEALEQEAHRQDLKLDVLLEVNASREENKHGFAPEEVPVLVSHIAGLKRLRVCGLMTMAALASTPEESRPTFAGLRRLRDRMKSEFGGDHTFEHLSMGMSNDFEAAIEEGATLIRVGSTILEGLPDEADD